MPAPSPGVRSAAPGCLLRATLTVALCVYGLVATALDPGTAFGRLRVDGVERALSSSAALDYADRAALARHVGDGPALRIALAGAAIPPDALDGPGHQALRAALADDAAPLLLLLLPRDAHGTVAARLLLLDALPEPRARFDAVTVTLARGERRVLGAIDWASADGRLRVLAKFSAPLFSNRAPDLVLDGAAARDSEAAASLIIFEQALRQGAFARARDYATARYRRSLTDLESRDEVEIATLAAALPAPETRRAGLSRLVRTGSRAWLVSGDPALPLIHLAREEERWRVDTP